MAANAWIIPLFPLMVFILLISFSKRLAKDAANIAITANLLSFLLSLWTLFACVLNGSYQFNIRWFFIGEIEITAGFLVNPLNSLMLAVVSFISLVIQVYSKEYMKKDPRPSRYFAKINLFTFSMLALVISANLLQIYVFWELVGLGSFLLIGYYNKNSAKKAAKKAFMMTRIGDVGLLIGIISLFIYTQSFQLDQIFQSVQSREIPDAALTMIAIFIFIGAMGKSAQFPLHSWLPDAMEGPAPVSALIHAATMVAAGVYLIAALYPLYLAAPAAMIVVAGIGGFTAWFAATIAVVEKDLKRVLAYSTVSQLGFMMLALGAFGYAAAIFHLLTHAFFKAMLFLTAGSVIQRTGTQDIRKMGDLRKILPVTHAAFLTGALAISGIPILSGFFSKEEILLSIFTSGEMGWFIVAVLTSLLTALYMFRLYFLVFLSKPRSKKYVLKAREPKLFTYPLMILILCSVFAGFVHTHWFGTFLGNWLNEGALFLEQKESAFHPIVLLGLAASLTGILLAYLIYQKQVLQADRLSMRFPLFYETISRGYYIDKIYQITIASLVNGISRAIQWFETAVLQRFFALIPKAVLAVADQEKRIGKKNPQNYVWVAAIGLVLFLAFSLITGVYL